MRTRRSLLGIAPAGAVALLLLLATPLAGGFNIRYWALIAILALAILAANIFAGGLRLSRGPFAVAVILIWAFAAWTMLSSAWADSAANAWEAADRTILYAAVITVPLALPGRRQALWVGYAIVGGVAAIAVITLFYLLFNGPDLFVAGRLNDPIGYRNATATLFAFCVWPLIGLAVERGRNTGVRGLAFAIAVLALGLAFLTQSRGVALGLVAGGVVSLAIGPDRVRRAWFALIAAGGVAVISSFLLEPWRAFENGEAVTSSTVSHATVALTLLTIAAFVFGLFWAILDNGLRSPQPAETARKGAVIGLGVVAAIVVVGALVAIGNPVTYASNKWDEFTNLNSTSTSSTRLGTVGGERYDLWRVALSEFSSQPVTGVGAGNYQFDYYKDRRTDRNLNDPHGLPFSLLSETGIVGTLLFVGFLIAIGVSITRAVRSSPPSDRRVIGGIAAAGTVVIAQALSDWLWLIPTVMGLGLLALALAAVPRGRSDEEPTLGLLSKEARGERGDFLGRLGFAALLGVAAISVLFLFLGDLYIREARSHLNGSPQAQLDAARTAADFNPVSVVPLYLQASAEESQGDRTAALHTLQDALSQEPRNFVTLTLLGDLEVRAGAIQDAAGYYQRALALNPRDSGLQQLAQINSPGSRLRQSR